MDNTKYTFPEFRPEVFASVEFLTKAKFAVDKYASLRARAVPALAAFRRIFGHMNCDTLVFSKIQNLEASDIYCDLFEAKLKALPIDELLSARRALHTYLEIAHSPHSKDSAKIAALKEACVLAGVTVIDEKGNTRLGRTLADFYADAPKNDATSPAPAPTPATDGAGGALH